MPKNCSSWNGHLRLATTAGQTPWMATLKILKFRAEKTCLQHKTRFGSLLLISTIMTTVWGMIFYKTQCSEWQLAATKTNKQTNKKHAKPSFLTKSLNFFSVFFFFADLNGDFVRAIFMSHDRWRWKLWLSPHSCRYEQGLVSHNNPGALLRWMLTSKTCLEGLWCHPWMQRILPSSILSSKYGLLNPKN